MKTFKRTIPLQTLEMGIQKDFYNKRLKELESLLKKSESQTSKSLLEEAIQLTRKSFIECERISKLVSEKMIFYDNVKKKFDEALKQLKEATSRIKATVNIELLSQNTKDKIIAAGEAMTIDINYQYDTRANANRFYMVLFRSVALNCVIHSWN